jgi:hypothetical protein
MRVVASVQFAPPASSPDPDEHGREEERDLPDVECRQPDHRQECVEHGRRSALARPLEATLLVQDERERPPADT